MSHVRRIESGRGHRGRDRGTLHRGKLRRGILYRVGRPPVEAAIRRGRLSQLQYPHRGTIN